MYTDSVDKGKDLLDSGFQIRNTGGFKRRNSQSEIRMTGGSSADHLSELKDLTRRRVFRAVKDLKQLDVSDVLQAEIIGQLLRGRRAVAELVEEIYGERKGGTGFMSAYSRTRRSIRELESRGYVATRLLGKDKPYRLTKYAISRLADFETPVNKARLVPRKDICLYILTTILASLALIVVSGYLDLQGLPLASFYATFFVFVELVLPDSSWVNLVTTTRV